MSGICEGRVVVITGAGRGLGRAHALAFAAEGARVVVNDLDVSLDGTRGGGGAPGHGGAPGLEDTPAPGGASGAGGASGPGGASGADGMPGPGGTSRLDGTAGPDGTPGAGGTPWPGGALALDGTHGPSGAPSADGTPTPRRAPAPHGSPAPGSTPVLAQAPLSPAAAVVDEIRAAGGEAVAHGADIATSEGAASLVRIALDTYGRLDTLVNNAGFLRDRMLVNLDEDDWDAVLRVHLKGHFLPLKHAAAHWRAEAKAGRTPEARIVNTSSGAGLLGAVGQGNYSAAKAGVVGLTLVAAAELGRYGVQVNAIAPAARTRMTERAFADMMAAPDSGFDAMAPENVSPLVVWLGSAASAGVTGRVFETEGGRVTVMEGWRRGPSADKGGRWTPADVGERVRTLLARAEEPGAVYGA